MKTRKDINVDVYVFNTKGKLVKEIENNCFNDMNDLQNFLSGFSIGLRIGSGTKTPYGVLAMPHGERSADSWFLARSLSDTAKASANSLFGVSL